MPGVEAVLGPRDTDADWRALGDSQPYWAVLSTPDFRNENLTPERIEALYATGRGDIDAIAERLAKATGTPPGGRALDFGCGVGRLTEAMTAYAGPVTGYDISPGMLAAARARGGKAAYVGELPDGPFDWINSSIVFQHIEPSRGLDMLEALMARLAPGGAVSLHFTIWREARLEPAPLTGWKARARAVKHQLSVKGQPKGHILMHDYDLSAVVRVLNRGGVEEMQLVSTNHAGHRGVIILGRKTAPARLV